MTAKAEHEALDELKSGIRLLESELEDGTLSRQRKKLKGMRETQTAMSSPDFDPNTDTMIDENFGGYMKRLREKFGPEDGAPAMEHIRAEAERIIGQGETRLVENEAYYAKQSEEQVKMLLKVKMVREVVDHAKEVLSGQPAAYQTNVPGDEALPQTWRS
ncbi:hypothetical protein LTR97_010643 [Elasticomyces elasticus]|uniref:Uncharacterized protein n=1 Tax=Elasticomyces elasticus TaxID=574655 RepID=A0AAN7ZRI0_9PEZI|nr:hypothetical protein LTR97_010643 [Elasticomyces elasticus]